MRVCTIASRVDGLDRFRKALEAVDGEDEDVLDAATAPKRSNRESAHLGNLG
jgi:hypothetical protein